MPKQTFAVVAFSLAGLVSACEQPPRAQTKQEIAALKEQITSLEQRVSQAEASIALQGKNITRQTAQLWQYVPRDGTVTLTADETGYGILHTTHGPFLISIVKAEPYLDGNKITFRLGNMTGATFSKANVKLEYGPPFDADSKSETAFEDYLGARKKKEERLLRSFEPGTYTDFQIQIAPSKPQDLRDIVFGIEFDVVELRRVPAAD